MITQAYVFHSESPSEHEIIMAPHSFEDKFVVALQRIEQSVALTLTPKAA